MSVMRRPGAGGHDQSQNPPRHHCPSGGFEAPLEQKAKIPACFGSEILWKGPAAVEETLKDHAIRRLRRPALRLADHEVAEHLYPRHRLQLFGIDEIGIELDRVRF